MWLNLTDHRTLDGPRTDPKFARGLVKSYAEGKLAKGQSKAQVSQKLDRLEVCALGGRRRVEDATQ